MWFGREVRAGFLVAAAVVTGAFSYSELCKLASPLTVQPVPVQIVYGPNSMHTEFETDVEFDPTSPFLCGCCEFRQSIRAQTGGSMFIRDGVPVNVPFVDPANPTRSIGSETNPQDYREDARRYRFGRITRYGHRGERQSATESYTQGGTGPGAANPNRATGCHYHATDKPGGFNLVMGHTYEFNVVFRMEIVCVVPACAGATAPHAQKEVIVSMRKTVRVT